MLYYTLQKWKKRVVTRLFFCTNEKVLFRVSFKQIMYISILEIILV